MDEIDTKVAIISVIDLFFFLLPVSRLLSGKKLKDFFFPQLQVDRATADLKNTNVRLKEAVHRVIKRRIIQPFGFLNIFPPVISCDGILFLCQMRSSRNFCIDIILLCIILGIAAYLYK